MKYIVLKNRTTVLLYKKISTRQRRRFLKRIKLAQIEKVAKEISEIIKSMDHKLNLIMDKK